MLNVINCPNSSNLINDVNCIRFFVPIKRIQRIVLQSWNWWRRIFDQKYKIYKNDLALFGDLSATWLEFFLPKHIFMKIVAYSICVLQIQNTSKLKIFFSDSLKLYHLKNLPNLLLVENCTFHSNTFSLKKKNNESDRIQN